jgi:hypothetical protein
LKRISRYFEDLASQGWKVIAPDLAGAYGTRILGRERWEWQAARSPDDAMQAYVWELFPIDSENLDLLRGLGIPSDKWWEPMGAGLSGSYRTILLPLNAEALAIHKQLDLPLPEHFDVAWMARFNNAQDTSSEPGT